jgi:tetratricopeptide (TPR) repeat protein/predicted Ser/Thr protein kinase
MSAYAESVQEGDVATEDTVDAETVPSATDLTHTDAADGSAETSHSSAPRFETGATVGRYLVLGRLGAGAMGVVLAAYDPELDRKVAVKLLKPRAAADGERGRARLQREAQALAKLSHPNVCAVHDVGIHGDQVFVAMEFIEGQTLTDWMHTEGPRPWREVLRRFDEAGRGLAAAHQNDLVHRDFKPDNAMIGDDGRVRVMDFGLARMDGELPGDTGSDGDPEAATAPQPGVPVDRLTRTGALLGTPAYMAAEQLSGAGADARSDQFAFCVSLYEALYGERPFKGQTLGALMVSVLEGTVAEPPRGHRVPSWIRSILLRGLAVEPADRWPSIESLLHALGTDPSARRTRIAAWTLGAAAFVGLSYAAASKPVPVQATAMCVEAGDAVESIWNDDARASIDAAFRTTEQGYAADAASRVSAGIDRYADAWATGRRDACEATHIRGEQSGLMLDRRMACYDRALASMRAAVDVLRTADASIVSKASMLIDKLPRLEACDDAAALERIIPPPDDPKVAERVSALENVLQDVKTRLDASRTLEARDRLAGIFDEARSLDYRPLTVRAELLRAKVHENQSQNDEARELYERAYTSAVELRMTAESAAAATALVAVLGSRLAKPDQGRAWALHAEALSNATGDPGAVANLAANLGQLEYIAGNYDEALALMKRGLEARKARYGDGTAMVAASCNNLGLVSEARGELDEAEAYYERAHAIWLESLGPNHPLVGTVINNMGNVHYYRAQWDRAAAKYRASLEIKADIAGPDHASLAWPYSNLGAALLGKGDYSAALEPSERALQIRLKSLGEEHPDVGTSYENLGLIHDGLGEHTKAIELYQASIRVRTAALGADHPDVAFGNANMGASELLRGNPDVAAKHYTRAAQVWRAKLGPDHINVALAETGLAKALLERDNPTRAVGLLEHALHLRESAADEIAPTELADTRFQLARALWSAGRERPRAVELARAARPPLADGGPAVSRELEQVDAWLSAHAP